jgi:peptidoglycan/xylan/chitin deacetylase (PgdA/CDA1 family)
MSDKKMTYFMYHELEPLSGPQRRWEEQYRRYIVTESEFRKQMRYLQESGIRGTSVTEALRAPNRRTVAITFDDGCETDLTIAAPLLREANCNATFYIVVGSVGLRGRLSLTQLRELNELGFEIGCHTMTHPHLDDLGEKELRFEIVEAKIKLEQMLGRQVDHLSCPGGRWNRHVADIAKDAGYVSATTSRIGVNTRWTDPFALKRVAIMRWTTLVQFQAACCGAGLWQRKVRELALTAAKRALGNSRYDQIRAGLLRRCGPLAPKNANLE